jgi:hypothetical protein
LKISKKYLISALLIINFAFWQIYEPKKKTQANPKFKKKSTSSEKRAFIQPLIKLAL